MAVERVDMFRVLCDGCGESDSCSEFYAWSDYSHAIDEASDSGWLITDDGKHFCDNCQTYDAEADEFIGVAAALDGGQDDPT